MHIEQPSCVNYKHPDICKCNYREGVCARQADRIHYELVRAALDARVRACDRSLAAFGGTESSATRTQPA